MGACYFVSYRTSDALFNSGTDPYVLRLPVLSEKKETPINNALRLFSDFALQMYCVKA